MRARVQAAVLWMGGMLLAAVLGGVAPGADEPASDKKTDQPASDTATAGGDAKAAPADAKAAASDFAKTFGEFKQILGKLRSLQGKYALASEKERPAIADEFNSLLAKGKELSGRLLGSAKAAYQAAPQADPEVGQFLFASLAEAVGHDEYNTAFELARLLVDGGFQDKSLYNYAGIAAFNSNEFELAKEWLQKADEADAIGKIGSEDLKIVDEYQKLWAEEQKTREAEEKADDLPRVKLHTTKGDIVLELFENEAPNTTANFISLVEKHLYDGTPYHRVLPGFMAQGGDPQGNGQGGPGYTIACEVYEPNHRSHFAGSISMAMPGKTPADHNSF